MITKVYDNYSDFLKRENKKENGVSKEFSIKNINFEHMNDANEGCYDCSGCYDCYGCSRCSRCSGCSRCYDCSRCSRCYDCSGCSRCSGCYDCYDCSDLKEKSPIETKKVEVPKVVDLHQKLYQAVTQPNAFDMTTWHTCETTHCRAGWVIHLAGEKGKSLESFFNTELAAMMIYDKSCPGYKINPARFYDSNEKSLADIKSCAEL